MWQPWMILLLVKRNMWGAEVLWWRSQLFCMCTVNERKKVNFPVCFEMERVIRNIGEHKSNNIWKQRSVNPCFCEELQLSSHISMKLTNASFRKFCHWTSDTDRECTVMTEVSVFRVLLLSNNLTLGSFHDHDRPGAY